MAALTLGQLPLVVIVGPTSSGKTAVAIELAKLYDGEVVAADSRTVYRGMDIGTAKPTLAERQGIAHYGFDLADPGERFTAAMFQQYATTKIDEIRQRGKLPIMVGGTGLYVDSVIFDYQFPEQASQSAREQFETMSLRELQEYCANNNVTWPINSKNRRHLIQAIIRRGQEPKMKQGIISNSLVVGIATDRHTLEQRFIARAEHMFDSGVVKEATILGKKYGWSSEAMTGNIYPLIRDYIEGRSTLEETMATFVVRDRQLAKRQMTWLRRNPWIIWEQADRVVALVARSLDERTHL